MPAEMARVLGAIRSMARTKSDPTIVRPSCPEHPASRVRLDGFEKSRWSDAHRRPRYRCVTVPDTRGHSFSLPVAVRQPSEQHPDSGAACPVCYGLEAAERSKAGKQRAREARERAA